MLPRRPLHAVIARHDEQCLAETLASFEKAVDLTLDQIERASPETANS